MPPVTRRGLKREHFASPRPLKKHLSTHLRPLQAPAPKGPNMTAQGNAGVALVFLVAALQAKELVADWPNSFLLPHRNEEISNIAIWFPPEKKALARKQLL